MELDPPASTVPAFPRRPAYPQIAHHHSSQTTSAFQSSNSLSSISAPVANMSSNASQAQQSSSFSQSAFDFGNDTSAPMPSPSHQPHVRGQHPSQQQPLNYFGVANTSAPSQCDSTPQQNQQQNQAFSQAQYQFQQQAHDQGSMSQEYRPQREEAGATAHQTTALIDELGLVAEAAKRAQMACLMRDMGEMDL